MAATLTETASRSSFKVTNAPRWTRGKSLAALRATATTPALAPAAGPALPWQPAFPVYKGQVDLATGNLVLAHPVTAWTALGPAISMGLVYNSESARTGALGARWTHTYEARIAGTSPAVVIQGSGREAAYSLSNGAYVAPAGFQETLVHAGNGTWTLTFKDGSVQRFGTSGQLTSMADANGSATTLAYSGGLLASVTDAAGRSESGVTIYNGTYTYDDDAPLTNVSDAVGTSGLNRNHVWNADGTLASMPANGYRRVMAYDEDGRLTGISKLQNGVTTALYQYGYGFDGNRRWRKDLAAGVWDWYPCGVACCAGELVTLRSTNGGTTWATLETKLSKTNVAYVNGSQLLAPTASGSSRMQGTTESAVTDTYGVIRAGTYGSKLSSIYEQLRGDAGLEQTLLQLKTPLQKKPGPGQYTRSECFTGWDKWVGNCQVKAGLCAGVPPLVIAICAVVCSSPDPFTKPACLVCVGAAIISIGVLLARLKIYNNCIDDALAWRTRCLSKAVSAN